RIANWRGFVSALPSARRSSPQYTSTVEPDGPRATAQGVASVIIPASKLTMVSGPSADCSAVGYALRGSSRLRIATPRRESSFSAIGIEVSGAISSDSGAVKGSTGTRVRLGEKVPADNSTAGCQSESSNAASLQPAGIAAPSRISIGGTGSAAVCTTSCRYGAARPFHVASEITPMMGDSNANDPNPSRKLGVAGRHHGPGNP